MPPLRLVERHRFLDSYGFVLVLIVTTYVTAVTLTQPWGATIVLVVQIAAVTVTLHVSHARRLVRVVAIVALVLSGNRGGRQPRRPRPTTASCRVLFACSTLLYVVAPFSIVRHVAQRQRIDVETFLGALAAYLLLGMAFAFSYRFLGEVQDTPFFGDAGDGTIADVLFFSFITLTTTGYGNLVPAQNPGQSLAVLEALLGQLFLVTAVAKIVSAWQPRRREAADGHRRMTLRIGFHGAGFITHAHRWLLQHAGVAHELAAVHDPDAARAAASPSRPAPPP